MLAEGGLDAVPGARILVQNSCDGEKCSAQRVEAEMGRIVSQHVRQFFPQFGFVGGHALFDTIPAQELGSSGEGGFEVLTCEPLDRLGEGMGTGELGDLGLALVGEIFEPGIGARLHKISDGGAAIVEAEAGGSGNCLHGAEWIDGLMD